MDNRDYIKEKFDNDGIRAPESLSEENILKMLGEADGISSEKKEAEKNVCKEAAPEKRVWIRPENRKVLAVAASAMIAIFGIAALSPLADRVPDTTAVDGELYSFHSTSEIKRIVKSLDSSPSVRIFEKYYSEVEEDYMTNGDSEELAMNGAGPADNAATSGSSKQAAPSGDHSETYLQVEDVDEADIVKTDGRYIYYVNKAQEVEILEAADGVTRKLSTIGSSGIENYIDDIFLRDDRLVTVGRTYTDELDEGGSGIVVYDISDRSHPEMLYDFRQTGDIVSSRMVGNYVYLVTNDRISKGGRVVPLCGTSGNCKDLGLADIRCMPDPKTPSYIVLSAVDIASGSQGRSSTKAVFGASSEIYCNDHALYSATPEYDDDSNEQFTRIARARFDGPEIRFDATARVRGYINNQFSMDEKDGYFRIATTSARDGMDVNNLYVLNESLIETGKVTGFARNESIKAVRFIGNKAYVITYQAIDPLFIIDLSDPEDPLIEGEVMIDGFSTLLVPVGESRLLGIGHATGDNGYGGEYDSGLKLALFDISDPSEPKVLDSREFENMTSPAQSDHKALTVNGKEGWFAIPYDIYSYENSSDDIVVIEDAEEPETSGEEYGTETSSADNPHQAGVLVFRAGDSIDVVDQHEIEATQLLRSVFIEDWIYALDADGAAGSFKAEL